MGRLTWRDVLDTNKFIHFGHISKVLPLVMAVGYDYFSWNGYVVKVIDAESFEWTSIKIEDLD